MVKNLLSHLLKDGVDDTTSKNKLRLEHTISDTCSRKCELLFNKVYDQGKGPPTRTLFSKLFLISKPKPTMWFAKFTTHHYSQVQIITLRHACFMVYPFIKYTFHKFCQLIAMLKRSYPLNPA